MNILTHYINPPIPHWDFDWSATTDNYEPGEPIAYAETEAKAISKLKSIINTKE